MAHDVNLQGFRRSNQEYNIVQAFGRNTAVSTVKEDIWWAGGVLVWPTAEATVSVVSSDAADDIAGTGARTVHIHGLDANFNLIEEDLNLDGLTPVVSVNSYYRINSAEITAWGAGATKAPVGNITGSISGNTQFFLPIGKNRTAKSHYTVPINKRILVTVLEWGSTGTVDATFTFECRFPGTEGWLEIQEVESENQYMSISGDYALLEAGTDLRIQGVVSAGTRPVTAHWVFEQRDI
jgi:hypothetical protein